MFDKFSEVLGKLAVKLNNNIYIATIRDAFVAFIPLTIVGSVGTLIGSVVCSTNGLASFDGLEFLLDYAPWFTRMNYATMNIMSLFVAFYIGRNLAKHFGHEGTTEGILAVVNFIIVCPTSVTTLVGEESVSVANVLSSDVTSAKGLFMAMLVSVLATKLYCKLCEIETLKITLPDSVPTNVSSSFTSLVPTILVTLIVSTIAFFFEKVTGTNLVTFIFTVIQTPMQAVFQHPLGIIILVFFGSLFWLCGIHGSNCITAVLTPVCTAALATNMDLVAAGNAPTEIVTQPFYNMFATMGGYGCTLALIIAIFIVSKREDDRAIAKLSIAPGLFGINEPMIFGIPIVMNPIMAIPFILCPAVCLGIGYFATSIGIAQKAISAVPWCLPPVVNGFIATGGDILTAVVQLVCIAVSVVIWIPFVKIRNKEIKKS